MAKKKVNKQEVSSVGNALSYKGTVKVKYLVNGKEVSYKGHNEGLNAMFKYICKILSGNTDNLNADRPAYFDARCEYVDATGKTVMESCIYNLISLSNPEYFYDTTLNSWLTRFTIVLSYNMINFNLLYEHPNAKIYLYLMSAVKNDFARLELKSAQFGLTDVLPGTQALIEWTMQIKNESSEE